MDIQTIIGQVDAEIAKLKQARSLLADGYSVTSAGIAKKQGKRRRLSAAGRAKIVAAVKSRWAKARKQQKAGM